MKHLRLSLLTALAMMALLLHAQTNVLRVDTVKAPSGKALSLNVVMENQSDVAGVQFDISVPYELNTNDEGAIVAEAARLRIPNHVVQCRKKDTQWKTYYPKGEGTGGQGMTYHRYRVIIYSDRNELVVDDQGTLLTLQLTTDVALENNALLPVYLENVTMTNLQKQNVATGTKNGAIIIEQIPRPDLEPLNVTFTPETVNPGGKFTVSWQVRNVGQKATEDGWTEQISLTNLAGTTSKIIATTYYGEVLAQGSDINRQEEIELPQNLGLDGLCKVKVEVVPTDKTGEHPTMRDNNIAISATNISLEKRLTLELSKLRFTEGSQQRVMAKLSRSGSWTLAQTFQIVKDPKDSRVEIQQNVTIPAGQSGVVFYFDVKDNDVLDADSIVTITVKHTDYVSIAKQIVIEDNEYPALKVQASKIDLNEGDAFSLTITTPRISPEPITLKIQSEDNSRFIFNSTAVIPANEESVTVPILCSNDELPNLEQSNKFTVSAKNLSAGEVIVILHDDDMPALTLELTPNKVSEGDGPTAVAAVLTRTGKTSNTITVRISDDSDGGLYYSNKSITMDKGVETVFFNLGPVDNAMQEGDRTYTVTAAIYVKSCSCSASGESVGSVQAQITVLDNDGAALSVSSQVATVKEGGETTLTVTRNTLNDVSKPLTVTLSSNYDDELEYNHSVTIPAGESSTQVPVKSKKNDVSGDSKTIVFTVAATGYASGTCMLLVTDQTLPDARAIEFTTDVSEAGIKSKITASVTIVNEGAYPLPANTPVVFYQQGKSEALGTTNTETAVPVGESIVVTRVITLPDQVGDYTYYAVVNASRTVTELVYTNNTSNEVTVKALSPFTATVKTDKQVYRQNATVIIVGEMHGENTANAPIDVYMINDGTREVKQEWTDADGKFYLEWQLYDKQSGHFAVGACYRNDPTTEEMATFDVFGLKRTENSYITCQATCGEAFGGSLKLVNAGKLPLTGVTVEVMGGPEGLQTQFDIPASIGASEEVTLRYSLTGTVPSQGDSWEMIRIRVISAEGAALEIPIHFYARVATGNLVPEFRNLNTTVVKATGRDISFMVTNTGKGNTGKISLSLPDFIKPLTGATMPGLNQNDTATVVLRIQPTDDMQLNVPVTGMLGINCENGNGTYIDYSIMPVSNSTGTLVVDVTDEFTYYTDEKPHVAGAEIVVRNPVTGALVAQGTSGADGLYTIELPEGYYQLNVTADKHDAYKNNVLVDPEGTTTKVINLSYQAISVSWNVVETEVEDQYDIVTTVKYETNVPTPVVETVQPDKLDLDHLGVGESIIYYAIMTNKGLIQAEDVGYTIPEFAGDYQWEPLVEHENLTLAPQQSYTIPVKVTRIEAPASTKGSKLRAVSNGNCRTLSTTEYWWECGKDHKWHKYSRPVTYTECDGGYLTVYGGGGGGTGPGSPGGGSSSSYTSTQASDQIYEGKDCNPCKENVHKIAKSIFDCAISFVDAFQLGCWYGLANGIMNHSSAADITQIVVGAVGCGVGIVKNDSPIGLICNIVNCTVSFVDLYVNDCGAPPPPSIGPGDVPGGGGINPPDPRIFHAPMKRLIKKQNAGGGGEFLSAFAARNFAVQRWLENYLGVFDEILGSRKWQDNMTVDERDEMLKIIEPFLRNREHITADALRLYKPQDVSDGLLDYLVERINNTIDYEKDETLEAENRIHADILDCRLDMMNQLDEFIKEHTGETVMGLFSQDSRDVIDHLEKESNNTCATIKLQIDQTMTMTRQAFRGTLTIGNGNKEAAMEDVKLKLKVTNTQTAQLATEKEFEMHTESLMNFKGELDMESGWYLGADSTGTATILFIPSKYAAPDSPIEYSFGGTLSYKDPNTDLEVTRELYPVTLTVKPSPELDLTYFMQRDLYGDDALTEAIEPVVPGEFAVIINNKGNGDATNVRMLTKQPKIIENEKGLYIDFEFVSSQLNGQDKVMAMGENIPTDFGNIPAHSQAYAQWWLQSSLLGHFSEYDIKATHVTSYGNENLSLLDQVTIHELIHGFTPPAGNVTIGRGFLVNDISDTEDLPDQIYFTDGSQAEVNVTKDAVIEKQSNTEYTLTVHPTNEGWNYGSLLDPTVGRRKLLSIVRLSDNKELPVDNMWQTDRTLIDGADWLYENRFHFIDNFPAASMLEGVKYKLTFEDRSEKPLEVESITGMELNGQPVRTTYVDEVTVTFNKAIQPETFTQDDVTLSVQGEKQDLSAVGFASEDNTVWKLDFTDLSRTLPNGYYVLTVQTTGIIDHEGYNGYNGLKKDWVLFLGGLVQVTTTEYPLYSGTIQSEKISGTPEPANAARKAPGDGNVTAVKYGDKYRFTATANEGFEFVNWSLNGVAISTNPVYETTITSNQDLVANFKKRQYKVDATAGSGGTVAGTGVYDYGAEVNIVATPKADFILKGWIVNGTAVAADGNTLTVTADKALTIQAEFVQDVFTQALTMVQGWNWVSTYLSEEQPLGNVTTFASRVLSQTDELVIDPEYGLMGNINRIVPTAGYKIEAATNFSIAMRGRIYKKPISVQPGWNWIAYPYYESRGLADVLTGAEEGDYIVSQATGFSQYSGGKWEGTLDVLIPGQGYLYKSVSSKQLTFDITNAPASEPAPVSQLVVDARRYPNTMNITARIYDNDIEVPAQQYTVYAFAGEELRGISQCVGSNHYLTVYGDDPVSITLIVENAETSETFCTEKTLTFTGDVVGSYEEPFAIVMGPTTGISQLTTSAPMTVYTVDGVLVSRDATIKSLRSLPKGVYIVNRRKCYIR